MYSELIDGIVSGKIADNIQLQKAKMDVCKRYNLASLPTNSEILANIPDNTRLDSASYRTVRNFLRLKPTRSLSGIVVVAVMTSPHPCPHGKCSYCPGGVDNGSPQSYTGREPAALRGSQGKFDPFEQTKSRLIQLQAIGHATDKVELIVMGGTFPARPIEYQEWFVKRCLDAMNGTESPTLEQAQSANMEAGFRCTGLTLETRPDWCMETHVDEMLNLGATRVELGVQTVYDDILKAVGRGHTVQDAVDATRIAKDAGLKVCYHMMPGLPGMTPEKDVEAFEELFGNKDFKPDMLKIYPTLIIKGTKLYDAWKKGEYKPYSTEEAVRVIAEAKKSIPKWVRIHRIQRDIPAYLIEDGVKKSHLRVLVNKKLESLGTKCNCIRCREIGLSEIRSDENDIRLRCEKYDASGGTEFFISFDDIKNDLLVAYARLRFPSQDAHRPEVTDNKAALLRELRVFGEVVELEKEAEGNGQWQHRSYGRKLLDECEKISRENGYPVLLVNSGVGVKPYYGKLGYSPTEAYMGKRV